MIVSYLSLKVFVITELVELAFCLVLGLLVCFSFPPMRCTYFLYRNSEVVGKRKLWQYFSLKIILNQSKRLKKYWQP